MSGETVAASASVVVALFALALSVWEGRRRATFEHLKLIDERVMAMFRHSRVKAQEQVRAYYTDADTAAIEKEGIAYLALLSSLDRLAFARRKHAISGSMTDEYVGSLLGDRQEGITVEFIRELQVCCRSEEVYKDLVWYIKWLRFINKLTWE